LAARPLSRSERLEMEQDTMPGAAAPGELPGELPGETTSRSRFSVKKLRPQIRNYRGRPLVFRGQ